MLGWCLAELGHGEVKTGVCQDIEEGSKYLLIVVLNISFVLITQQILILILQYNIWIVQSMANMLQTGNIKLALIDEMKIVFLPLCSLSFLTLSNATFENRGYPWKTMKDLSETVCCYIEIGPISKLSSHEKNRVEISKTG